MDYASTRPTMPKRRRATASIMASAALLVAVAPVSAGPSPTSVGPSTTIAPYVLPVAADVRITSVLTVGDGSASNGYRMVGIPDGLGLTTARAARLAGKHSGKLVLYMNHELRDTQGIARRHGQAGAFVSRLVIDPRTLEVTSGSDLIDPGVRFWDYPNGDYVTTAPRFVDLAPRI